MIKAWMMKAPSGDSYTKSLLHFNGDDDSTTFTDESGKTWTRQGLPVLDTAEKVFGVSSGYFTGRAYALGNGISTEDHADFHVPSGDWTIDFWIKRNSTGGNRELFNHGSGDSQDTFIVCVLNYEEKITFAVYGASGNHWLKSTSTISNSAFSHVAIVRSTNLLSVYINGHSEDSHDISGWGNLLVPTGHRIRLCSGESGITGVTGWIDEFRFSKGIARWTENFTPPTSEYSL